MNIRFLDE